MRGVGSRDDASTGSRSSLRDLYSRARTQPTDARVDNRRVTTDTIANRYQPRGDTAGSPRKTTTPRDTSVGAVRGRTAPVRTTVDRYSPTPQPRATSAPTRQPRGTGVIAGSTGTRAAPPTAAPRLNPRSGYTAPGTRSYYGYGYNNHGYCSVPGWSSWYGCNSSMWMTANIGSWWWSSSWCSPSWYYYGSSSYWYNGWSYNWCRPRHRVSTCWWWPTSCYYPTYYYGYDPGYDPGYDYQPTYVTVVQNMPAAGTGEVVASAPAPAPAELTPAELAQKYVGLGDFYFSEGRFSEAADAYARARTYAPGDPTILFVLADATFATGDYHYAAYLIGEALRMDPGMAGVEADKRLLYKDVKVFEAQLKTLESYLTEKPYDAMARLVLAYNLKFSGRGAEAIKAFERTLEVDPESSAARIFLAALTAPAPAPAPVKDAEKKPPDVSGR